MPRASRIENRESTDTESKCIRFARDAIVCASHNLTSISFVCRLPEQTNASSETTIPSVSANSLRDEECVCVNSSENAFNSKDFVQFVCLSDVTITFDMINWSHSATSAFGRRSSCLFIEHIPSIHCEPTSTTFRLHTNCVSEGMFVIAQMGFMNGLPKCRNAILQRWPRQRRNERSNKPLLIYVRASQATQTVRETFLEKITFVRNRPTTWLLSWIHFGLYERVRVRARK